MRGIPSTLLGPEGAAAFFGRFLTTAWASLRGADAPRGPLFRPYFENCIVDASIFCFLQKLHVVPSVKFIRAHGGCLGTRSR